MKPLEVHVRRLENDEIVHSVPTEFRGRALAKMVSGMERNMNLDEYYVDASELEIDD